MLDVPALLLYWHRVFIKYGRRPPRRYRELLQYIAHHQVRSILEIGVYTGTRAMEMIRTASIWQPIQTIEYIGFDLFEDLTPELCKKEFSKMPLSETAIREYLSSTGARIDLRKGYSKDTLAAFIGERSTPVDFIFIDGGHAEETIENDWKNVESIMGDRTMVFFDDYYSNNPMEVPGIGCQKLIHSLDSATYDVRIGRTEDRFQKSWGTLRIKLASVSRRTA